MNQRNSIAFNRLLEIMDTLRAQCPWDKKQTWESLRTLTIEELYELTDALLAKDAIEVKKELGDVLLHLVFYAKIAEEQQLFNIDDVIHSICNKLIDRHPHIYGNIIAETEQEVKSNWEKLKLKEGKKSVLEGVPKSLPAMVKAQRIQEKARGVGFDWQSSADVWLKVKEEISEFEAETAKQNNMDKINEEFGDLIFSLINYARFMGINPENALEQTNVKFIKRFTFMEQQAAKQAKAIHELSFEEMDELWNMAKSL